MKTQPTPRGRPRRTTPDTRTTQEKFQDRLTARRERAAGIVKHFDSLPDMARVKPSAFELLLGISGATLWRRIKKGEIQEPSHDGRSAYWTAGYIRSQLGGHMK